MMTDQEIHLRKILNEWDRNTRHCSFWHMMRKRCPQELMEAGRELIPILISKLRRSPDIKWSMLLAEITGERPDYEPDRVGDTGFAKWDVQQLADAWIRWFENTEAMHLTGRKR